MLRAVAKSKEEFDFFQLDYPNQSAKAALQQIKNKDYTGAYQTDPRQKVLLGINFSSEKKTVDDWLAEDL